MPISVTCETCAAGFRVRDELAGRKTKCKSCGATVVVPDGDDAPARQCRARKSRKSRQKSGGPALLLIFAGGFVGLALLGLAILGSRRGGQTTPAPGGGTAAEATGAKTRPLNRKTHIGFTKRDPPAPYTVPVRMQAAEGDWITFEIEGAGFTVEIPEVPDQDLRGDDPHNHLIFHAMGDRFSVKVIRLPFINFSGRPRSDEEEYESKYKYHAEGTSKSWGITTTKIEFAGRPALELRKPDRTVRRHLYRDGHEIILMFDLPVGAKESQVQAERDRFFNSFRFKE